MLEQHLEKLSHFHKVASLGTFRAASESLHLTQPTLSKSIKVLESNVGHQLFHRSVQGVRLTAEGEVLFRYCGRLFQDIEAVQREMDSPKDPFAQSIRIGTYDSIAIYFWPEFLRDYSKRFPHLNIELETGRSMQMYQRLIRNEIDLAVIVSPPKSAQLEQAELAKDHFAAFVAPKSVRAFTDVSVAPLIIMPETLVDRQGVSSSAIEDWMRGRRIYRTSSLQSARVLAESGLGVAVLPRRVAKKSVKQRQLREIEVKLNLQVELGWHPISAVWRKDQADSGQLRELVGALSSFGWE